MFSVARSAGEGSGTSQSFLGNKDSKARYNQPSKERPETQVELEQWEQHKMLLTIAAMSGICISADQMNQFQMCSATVTTSNNVSMTWSVHCSGYTQTAKSSREKTL